MTTLGLLIRDLTPAVEFGWPGRAFVFLLMVGVPLLSLLQPDDGDQPLPPRQALYISAIVGVWILAALSGLVLWAEEIAPSLVGLHAPALAAFLIWTGAATIGTLAGNFAISRGAAGLGIKESRLTYHLMPRNRGERWSFFAVSASAGFCEEFTYHGFLLAGLTGWLSNGWLAAVVANLAFGVLHGYQGQAGMIRAFLMGYVLCLPVILGAGLWPAIAAHSLVNVLLGLGLWKWMVPEEEWRRVTDSTD
ncbi:MAG: CPBP family intramembrane metalloprotease [Gemmatimonadota bacterium]|nr:MAG: CPBP family intramembrane metalloprotease [Gemmatimonadota bacterium]